MDGMVSTNVNLKGRNMKLKQKSRYSLMHEMLASPTAPMPAGAVNHQLTRMFLGIDALEKDPDPSTEDWSVVSDAINLMETLVLEMQICDDSDGLLADAITAMAMAGKRPMKEGYPIRLSGAELASCRAVLADYADKLKTLSERTMMRCHRLTERRLMGILKGRRLPHDVEVVSL